MFRMKQLCRNRLVFAISLITLSTTVFVFPSVAQNEAVSETIYAFPDGYYSSVTGQVRREAGAWQEIGIAPKPLPIPKCDDCPKPGPKDGIVVYYMLENPGTGDGRDNGFLPGDGTDTVDAPPEEFPPCDDCGTLGGNPSVSMPVPSLFGEEMVVAAPPNGSAALVATDPDLCEKLSLAGFDCRTVVAAGGFECDDCGEGGSGNPMGTMPAVAVGVDTFPAFSGMEAAGAAAGFAVGQ